MSAPRVILDHAPPGGLFSGALLLLPADRAHYLGRVLRLGPGAHVEVSAPGSGAWLAEVAHDGHGALGLRLIAEAERAVPESRPLVLVQGMLKGEKMDLVIQKATELGVGRIVPVVTERGIVRETRKLDRWRMIAREAARQSGGAEPPAIDEPVALADALRALAPDSAYFFHEGDAAPLAPAEAVPGMGEVAAVVGPEGGFSPAEAALARDLGLQTRSLGSRILRAETAGIVSVALLGFMLRSE
jgi:16S rRNA (uracil1498-N3)-methyltransferase